MSKSFVFISCTQKQTAHFVPPVYEKNVNQMIGSFDLIFTEQVVTTFLIGFTVIAAEDKAACGNNIFIF